MTMNLACPKCHAAVAYDAALAGQVGQCPKCRDEFTMPAVEKLPAEWQRELLTPTPVSQQAPPPVQPRRPLKPGKKPITPKEIGLVCVGVFVLVVVGTVWTLAYMSSVENYVKPDVPAAPVATKLDAGIMSERFVEKKLVSPGTAKFPSWWNDHDKDVQVIDWGDGRFHVMGWVDSQNSFGGLIRTKYLCELHTDDGETWTLDSLVLE